MSQPAKIKKTLGRMLTALGADLSTAQATEFGWTRVTLNDGSKLSWNRLPEEAGAEIAWEWMHCQAEGWFIADGASEDRDWFFLDLARHLRAA